MDLPELKKTWMVFTMNYTIIFSIIAMLLPMLTTGMQTPVSTPYAQTIWIKKSKIFHSSMTVFNIQEKIKKTRTKKNKTLANQKIELQNNIDALLAPFKNNPIENATTARNNVESESSATTVTIEGHLPLEELTLISEMHILLNNSHEENMQTPITPAQSSSSNIENSEPVAQNVVNTLQPRVKELIQLTKHHKKNRSENNSISHFILLENHDTPKPKRTRRIFKPRSQRPEEKSIIHFSLNKDQ